MASKTEEEELPKVVLTQTLCKIEQVFVYKIPPMKNAQGHRAEDWDLAKPAATCSLQLVQRDNSLQIQLLGHRPTKTKISPGGPQVMEEFLFAQATIVSDPTSDKPLRPIEYWVEAVVDSSRYFVVRCEDEKSKRQAHVGIGFRERDESLNFKMGMEDFWRSIERERKALHLKPLTSNDSSSTESDTAAAIGNLSLKEGEKIFINLKGTEGHSRSKERTQAAALGKGGLLLKKPPPPAGSQQSPRTEKDTPPPTTTTGGSTTTDSTSSSVAIDEDDWGDFEG